VPSASPTASQPSCTPSKTPSQLPSGYPTSTPTTQPTTEPTSYPSTFPTTQPRAVTSHFNNFMLSIKNIHKIRNRKNTNTLSSLVGFCRTFQTPFPPHTYLMKYSRNFAFVFNTEFLLEKIGIVIISPSISKDISAFLYFCQDANLPTHK
jgi:hypothetical protein